MTLDRKLSADWAGLKGQVPERGKGTTADRIERDKTRKRKRYPTEDRRVGKVIGPTLSLELVERLREICKEAGYTRRDGTGQIASLVIEDLLWIGISECEHSADWPKKAKILGPREVR